MASTGAARWSFPVYAFMVGAWGINYLVVRALVPFGGPLWLAAMRAGFGGAAALLFLALPTVRGQLSPTQRRNALLLGLVNTGGMYGLWFLAAAQVPPGETAVLVYTFPLQVAILGIPVHHRWPTPIAVAALFGGMLGVVLVTEPWTSARLDPWAVLALLGAAFCWAVGTISFKRWFRPQELLAANPYQLLGGAAGLLVLAIGVEPQGLPVPSPTFWVEALYLGVFGTALAYAAWFALLSKIPEGALSTYTFLVPVVALAASLALTGERVDPIQLAGIVLVVGSLIALGRSQAANAEDRRRPTLP